MSVPAPAEPRPDTVLYGFGMGWLAMVAAGIVVAVLYFGLAALMSLLPGSGSSALGLVLMPLLLLKPAAPIALGVWFSRQGRKQAAKGAFAALLSAIALGLLLIAACFGVVFFALSGNMH